VTQNKLLFIRDTETKRALTNGLELGPKIVHQKILELFSTSATNTDTKLVNVLRFHYFIIGNCDI
jgi:hypothetical protein